MAVVRAARVELHVNGYDAYAYVAQPDDEAQHPGVVLIQEWWGIEPHIQDLAQKLAAEGFVVAVPDLYHGKVATEPNDAMRMMMQTRNNLERAIGEIIGTLNTVKTLPNVEPKKLGVIGFCFGGLLTYLIAQLYPDLAAVVTFYGGGYNPAPEDVAKVTAPVLAIYGRQDEGIPLEQIEKIEQLYRQANKDFTVKIYEGGHAFINPAHGMGNEESASQAWPLAVSFLKEHVK